jgi:serine/threonine-protein kinase RsbW
LPEHNQTQQTETIVIDLNLPAQYRYLSLVGSCIRELVQSLEETTLSTDLVYGLQLAVHEICNNIIKHAYGHEEGRLMLSLTIQPSRRTFVADLYDTGRAFDPQGVPAPNLDVPHESGYGLFLARQLMDEVHYDTHTGRNHWQLCKRY